MNPSAARYRWTQTALVALLCIPLAILAYDFVREIRQPGVAFGPDPAETIVRYLGEWAIRILLATLAVSPLARLLRRPRLVRFRRTFGLAAFSYAVAHFAGYLVLLAGLDAATFLADFVERPYITVGLAALVLLVPLAVTSTRGWQRRLARNWRRLHRLVYAIGVLACIHLLWLSKGDYMDAALYGGLLALLLGERGGRYTMSRRRRRGA
ncbi:MAG: sulfoxide reductase heme-binding subunit YedZ [Gammaproteobacteria bacterium]|nr:sulfoxide reductase heme-binding subunit YedZ [Gammaproteobacteria bacterium]